MSHRQLTNANTAYAANITYAECIANARSIANAAHTANHDSWVLRQMEDKHCLLYNRFMKGLVQVQDLGVGGCVQYHLAGHLYRDHQEIGPA